jgi:hypothetical protein
MAKTDSGILVGPNDHTVAPLGISAAQARPLESPTLKSADSPEFVIQLEVFHQLHCLNVLRRTLYLDHYLKAGDPAELAPFGDYVTANGQRNYTSWSGLHQGKSLHTLIFDAIPSINYRPLRRCAPPSHRMSRRCNRDIVAMESDETVPDARLHSRTTMC